MKKALFGVMCVLAVSMTGCGGCGSGGGGAQMTKSAAGVAQAQAKVKTDADGHSVEQKNILERLKRDNEPGAVKHLYVISAYSGQVLLYSPVTGKVTSSGKRLTPTSVAAMNGNQGTMHAEHGLRFVVNGEYHYTGEVIQDDGTYGSSIEYLYWFTPDGRYHQHYLGGGQIVHVADQPMNVKGVVITIEGGKK